MTTTLAFAFRAAVPADIGFEHYLYASTRDDLRPLGPEVFDGLVGMQFRAQSMSLRLEHPQADRQIILVEDDLAIGLRMFEPERHRLRAELHADQTIEIGRASCRERVCLAV